MVFLRFSIALMVGALLLFSATADGYSICRNPGAYLGRIVDDPWRTPRYRGECVSFVKVYYFDQHVRIGLLLYCNDLLHRIVYRRALEIIVTLRSGEGALR